MPRTNQNVWLGCAGVAALAVTGCQTAERHASPGALPSETPTATKTDKVPTINASTYFAHAHLLERQGAFDRAIDQYRKVLELQPDFIGARNRMGITLNKLGKHADATTQFKLALQKQPNSAYLHNNLGFSLFLERRYEDARGAFEKSLSFKPDFSRARMNYGVTLGKLGYFDLAFEQFSKVCAAQDAYYNMGVLLTEAGHYGEAATNFEQALAVNPQFEAARAQLNDVARLAAEVDAQMKAIADAKAAAEAERIAAAPPIPAGQAAGQPTGSADLVLASNDDGLAPTPAAEALAEPVAEANQAESTDCDTVAPGAEDAAEPTLDAEIAPFIDGTAATPAAQYDDAPAQDDSVSSHDDDDAAHDDDGPVHYDDVAAPYEPAVAAAADGPSAEISIFQTRAINLLPFGESRDPLGFSFDSNGLPAEAVSFESLMLDPWQTHAASAFAPPIAPFATPSTMSDCDDDASLNRAANLAAMIEEMIAAATTSVGQIDAMLNRIERMLAPKRPAPVQP